MSKFVLFGSVVSYLMLTGLAHAEALLTVQNAFVQYFPAEGYEEPTVVVRYEVANNSKQQVLAYKAAVSVTDAVGDWVFHDISVLNTAFLEPGESRVDSWTYKGREAELLTRYGEAQVYITAIRFEDASIERLAE